MRDKLVYISEGGIEARREFVFVFRFDEETHGASLDRRLAQDAFLNLRIIVHKDKFGVGHSVVGGDDDQRVGKLAAKRFDPGVNLFQMLMYERMNRPVVVHIIVGERRVAVYIFRFGPGTEPTDLTEERFNAIGFRL